MTDLVAATADPMTTPAPPTFPPDTVLFAGQRAKLVRDGVTGYDVVRIGTGTGAVVVPRRSVRGTVQFALVSQWRHALRETTWEFPRGGADRLENTAEAAQRELAEETGFELPVGSMRPLGQVAPDTGILDTRVAVYLADVTGVMQQDLVAETDDVRWVTHGELMGLIMRGEITCGFTLSAYALLVSHGHTRRS